MFSLILVGLIVLVSFILPFFVLKYNPKNRLHQLFFIFAQTNTIWAFVNLLTGIYPMDIWVRGMYGFGAMLESSGLVWFFYLIDGKISKLKYFIVYLFGFIFLALSLFTDYIVERIDVIHFGYFEGSFGPLFYIYSIFLSASIIYIVIRLFWAAKISHGVKKLQFVYVAIGAAIFAFFAIVLSFLLPLFTTNFFSQFDLVGSFIFLLFITYTITRFKLFDIKYVLTRSILYAVLVGIVALFFSLAILLAGQIIDNSTNTSNVITYIISSLVVVLFLDPVKRVFARFTDKIFYKDKIDYQQVLQQVASVLASEIDLQKLLQNLVMRLTALLKIKKVSVWVPTNDHFSMIAFAGAEKKAEVSKKFTDFIVKKNKLIVIEDLLRSKEGAVNTSEQQELENFLQEAEANKIELIIPVIEENKISALIFCGSKQSGDFYSGEEINFFELLMPQVATAVRKSQLYEDLQELNVSLQSKVEERTKSLQEANDGLIERNKFLTTMQVVTGLISHNLDIKKVNQQITDSIASELGYVGGLLIFADFKENVLKLEAITQSPLIKKILPLLPMDPFAYKSPIQEGYNLGMQTFLSGKINFTEKIADVLHPPVPSIVLDQIQKILGVKTVVCIPIFSEAKIIGIIHFFLKKTQSAISSLDIETMTALTNQVGIVYSNLQLYNTLQKANRDLQEANMHLRDLDKAKSEFLSIASHQLRTPISAIKGYLSMILDGDFGKINNPKVNEVMKGIFESSTRLARLVNIFLNVSRIESGRLKLEKRPTQVNDLITSVISELIGEAKKKGLKLTYQENKNLPLINIDPDKIRDVILNLIDNSIKYTPKGSVKVSVTSDPKFVNFVVNDTGIGIDPVEANGLFRKFVRGSGVAQIHTGGSGLGLFIAQKMIKEHGGRVWAESEGKEKGSTFQFVLPFNDQDRLVENT